MPLETLPNPAESRRETFGPTIQKNIDRFRRVKDWGNFTNEIGRVRRVLYDVMDNFKSATPPREHRIERASADPDEFDDVIERFKEFYAPPELMARIFELFPEHGNFEHHDVVGNREEGTGHGHRYIIERSATEAAGEIARILFVDPEHHVGEKNFLRPAIINLMAMEVNETSTEFELRTLRVRTETLDEQVLNSFPKLRVLAEQMLDNCTDSDCLELLGIDPKEVIYYATCDEDGAALMSRYTGETGIQAIHQDTLLPRFILEKILSHQGLLKRIIQKAEAGKYRAKEPATRH